MSTAVVTPEKVVLTMPFHPAASIFPLLEGADFDALVADVFRNGLLEPIVTLDGKVLDGRNRYRACQKAGVTPTFRDGIVLPGEELSFVISKNLCRRHLDESQRAMVAARLATMKSGARTDLAPIDGRSQPEAAKLLNVSTRSVQRATVVLKKAKPEDVAAVERGEATINKVLEMVRRPSWVKSARAVKAAGRSLTVSKMWGAGHDSVERELCKAEDAARALLHLDKAVLHADRKAIARRVKPIKQAFSAVLTKSAKAVS